MKRDGDDLAEGRAKPRKRRPERYRSGLGHRDGRVEGSAPDDVPFPDELNPHVLVVLDGEQGAVILHDGLEPARVPLELLAGAGQDLQPTREVEEAAPGGTSSAAAENGGGVERSMAEVGRHRAPPLREAPPSTASA